MLYCLKIKLGATYRELSDWLAEMPRIREALGWKRLPHFTTVQKAFQRLSPAIWRLLQRIKLQMRALKTTLLVDTRAQTVLDLHVTTTRQHDTQVAPPLTERALPSAQSGETVISSLKRKYGDAVSSRVWWRQFRELVAVCLVYNVERAVKLGVTLLDWLWSCLLYLLHWRISTEPMNSRSRRQKDIMKKGMG